MALALGLPNLATKRLNDMAEESKPAVEEQGPPPWEMDFNPVVKYAQETIEKATAPIKAAVQGLMPWEMNFGSKRPVEAPSDIPAQKPSFSFDQVFNKLIQAESRGVHETKGQLTTSSAGAQGITQLMPATANKPGFGITPVQDNSKEEYLRVGRQYLQALVKEFDGDYRKAVAAYNAGIGNVKKAITKGGENWEQFLPKKSETLPYLKRILG